MSDRQVIAPMRARAPLRLGLAGGGTDLSPYCDQHGGAVLNVTIDRFAFAHVSPSADGQTVFRASDLGEEERYAAGHPIDSGAGLILHKAVYRHFTDTYLGGTEVPLVVSTTADAPPGSGLGSSSAVVVALIEAFRAALDAPLGPYEVARLAFDIERIRLGLAGGRQDQYAAAFGGLNYIEFLDSERVVVNPLRAARDHLIELESSLVACFTGQSRRSETIIREQLKGLNADDPVTLESMHALKADAAAMKAAVLAGEVREVAEILNRSWRAKKRTASGVATGEVDRLYDLALAAGAWGGKVSGAGGGGFLMLLTDPENRYRLVQALNAAGGQATAVKFTYDGAEAWRVRR